MAEVIAAMLANRRLERVHSNPDHALSVLEMAERHIGTAVVLADTPDVEMAFTAAYDGARKALAAVLAVEGLRVRPAGGAHHNTGLAAAHFVGDDALREFDWMRQVRNATEYPDDSRPPATPADVSEGIDAAEAIVRACAAYVRSRT